MFLKFSRAAIAATMLTGAAHAADSDGNFAAEGAGLVTCNVFTETREAAEQDAAGRNEYLMFLGYISGYATAYNRFSDETFDITPWQGLELQARAVMKFCSDNPEQPFVNAVNAVLSSLETTRLKEQSEVIEVSGNGETLALYREVLARAQRKLISLGLYDGEADGQFGPATRRAILTLQEDFEGLPKHGLPDQNTLLILFSR